jgi:subtilisin family serine protease
MRPFLSILLRRSAWLWLLGLVLITTLPPSRSAAAAAAAPYRAGQVIVHLRDGAGQAAAQRLAAGLGAAVLDQIPELRAVRLRLPAGLAVPDAIARLTADPDVASAEPNMRYTPAALPDDPLYPGQSPYLKQIDAPAAWSQQTGDQRVIVAVLDTGIDISHPDLAANIWTNPSAGPNDGNNCGMDLHGCNFVDGQDVDPVCSGASTAPAPNPNVTPDYWHGTFVAGVIGAVGNNALGVAGIDWHISLMPVRVGDCTGPNSDSVAQGIIYAARNGARVINMSFGEDPGPDNICHDSSQVVADAVRVAHDRYGAVLVAPSGTGSSPNGFLGCVDYPAAYPQVIAVGAAAPDDTRAPFSQFGPEVAVAAPAIQIISTSTLRPDQPPPDDLYRVANGTSLATAIVSGEAALLISQNHVLTPDQVRSLIQAGATPVADQGASNWAGAGRIDLAASLQQVPAGIYGTIQSSAPVPDGTLVEARIGTLVCGSTQTFTLNGLPTYTIFLPPFSVIPGCGLPGAVVDVSVDGARGGAAVWRPTDIHLDLNLLGSD